MQTFPSHGGLRSAWREGRIVYAHGAGASNVEAMAAYHRTLQALVAELAGSRWGVIGSSDDEALLTPEAEELMRTTAARLTLAGRVAVALVLPQSAALHLMRAQWTRIFEDAGCAFAFFDNRADARVWLEARLAEADARAGAKD